MESIKIKSLESRQRHTKEEIIVIGYDKKFNEHQMYRQLQHLKGNRKRNDWCSLRHGFHKRANPNPECYSDAQPRQPDVDGESQAIQNRCHHP